LRRLNRVRCQQSDKTAFGRFCHSGAARTARSAALLAPECTAGQTNKAQRAGCSVLG